jgi:orotidine-5'-phosphate decarboxylase
VGCTATSELGEIRSIIGEERLILSPGLGPQGGDPAKAFKHGANSLGEGLIISSSRSIDYAYESLGWDWERYAEAATLQAKNKRDQLNELKSSSN